MRFRATAVNKEKSPAAKSKLVYRLDEVSRRTGVDAATIDAWEQEFPFLNAGRAGDGSKIFREKDVAIIRRVRELLEEKRLTLAGIKRRIEEEFGLAAQGPVHPEKLRKALFSVRDELQEIAASLDPPKGRPKKS